MKPPTVPELALMRLGIPAEEARATCKAAREAWAKAKTQPLRETFRGALRVLLATERQSAEHTGEKRDTSDCILCRVDDKAAGDEASMRALYYLIGKNGPEDQYLCEKHVHATAFVLPALAEAAARTTGYVRHGAKP